MRARFGTEPAEVDPVASDAAIARILGRRTHRSYARREVPQSVLDVLLAAALSASAKSDYQQASILHVRDPEKRRRIADLVPAMPWIGDAPVFLVFCADARRLRRISEMRGHPAHNADLEAFFNATVDAALCLQTFVLAAEAAGLGCCPISVIRNHLQVVCPLLDLPPGVLPVAGLCVGYPSGTGHASMRLPPSVTLHQDRYDDAALAQRIDDYDRRRDARHAIPREKQRAPAKFGHADFYGWSDDKTRQLAEREGSGFGAFVRKHGFTLD
ncbi:MAG: nitroreductase family protein [Alphaproteobacteria bacterium]|nr:nitroreductase family protein [Alphaproteobacteria bacterium]